MNRTAALGCAERLTDEQLEGLGIKPEMRPIMLAFGRGKKVVYEGLNDTQLGAESECLFFSCEASHYKIIEPNILVNGVECETPLLAAPVVGTAIFLPSLTSAGYYFGSTWFGCDADFRWLRDGLVYLNADHAAQRGKAMRLYSECTV